jgi:hypothetical protein
MSAIGPPYQIREEDSFREDLALIHSDPRAFDSLFAAIQFMLERAPYLDAKPVYEDRGIWVRKFHAHTTPSGDLMPEVRVSYQIIRNPPDGLISLRHVRTPEDIQSGIHVYDVDETPP